MSETIAHPHNPLVRFIYLRGFGFATGGLGVASSLLDHGAGAEDHQEDRDERGKHGAESRLEGFKPLVERMSQRSRDSQNHACAHRCAARVGTRHARPLRILYRE